MRQRLKYCVLLLVAFISGCTIPDGDTKKWRITLDEKDKGPYGTYLAYESLKYYFPGVQIGLLSPGFRFTHMNDDMMYNYSGRSLLILEGMSFHVSSLEWEELKKFVKNGNEIMLFCSSLDDLIQTELNIYKLRSSEEERPYYATSDVLNSENTLSLTADPYKKYGYEGRSLHGYFNLKNLVYIGDTSTVSYDYDYPPDTLGLADYHPNFVRYQIGEGHISIHAAPLVLSNYFLLQAGNKDYLTGLWQTLPANVNKVYWNGYSYRIADASSFGILWRHSATRWALLLGVILALCYIFFEGKRKQRIIPVIPPLKNDSVSFVETVGRLYYNKGDHANLAAKMVQQFLEWVRSHYFLNTNLLNENFIHQLTIKSGQPEATVRSLMEMIHEIRLGYNKPDDAYLYQLYNTIQQFYKNHR